MFCPKCRSEYRSGFTRCSDCEIDLVHELPPPPPAEMEYVDYEAILETNSPGDIALVKSVLEAEEITYFFQGEYSAPYMYYAVPMRLMVRKDQAAKAIEILKDLNLSFTFGGQHNKIEEEND